MLGGTEIKNALHLLITFQIYVVYAQIEWKTVLLATKSSGVNIFSDLFVKWGQSINKDATTNEMDSVFDIAKRGTFRSPLIDSWAVDNHTHIRLGVFNSRGGLLWWVTFDGFLSDLTNWNRPTRIQDASHNSLMKNQLDTTVNFDANGINVTTADKGWLWVVNDGATNKMVFSRGSAKTFPGASYSQQSNSAMLATMKATPTNTFSFGLKNYLFWIGLGAKTYLIGFGIGKEAGGEITELMLRYSANDSCFNNLHFTEWEYYKNSSGLPMKIKPTYDASGRYYLDNSGMLTSYGKCWAINIIKTSGSTSVKAYVFMYNAQGDFQEGEILAIQWGQDPQVVDPLQNAVDKIQTALAYDKYGTARYRSQFTSASDPRPSAVMFGVAGLVVFLLIIAGIILLDIATLRRQIKYAKRNTVVFRQKTRDKWRSLKVRTTATFARMRAGLAAAGNAGKSNMAAAGASSGKAETSKTKNAPKTQNAKAGTSKVTVNFRRGSSGVSAISSSSKSSRSQPSTSKNKAGSSIRQKPPAVLTQISE